ncbi:MAG: FAD-dependent oxidoreductase, partial [Clostridia bacterium]|nr:FAD-dependent oxidoreductase [Clostridia bacterium]
MKTINEALSTPVAYECDVAVVGGGIAGISAALAAARRGASVLLFERSFVLGGLAT